QWGSSAPYSYDYSAAADRIVSFSQRSETMTEIFAPGAFIDGAGAGVGDPVISDGGTSQATPHITGIATLAQQLAIRELGRRLTMDEFITKLQDTAVIINDSDDEDVSVTPTNADYYRVDLEALGAALFVNDAPPITSGG